jgi:hypothetical protein
MSKRLFKWRNIIYTMKASIFTIWLFLFSVTADNLSLTCGSIHNICTSLGCVTWCKIIGNTGGICLTHPEPPPSFKVNCECACYKKRKLFEAINEQNLADMEWTFLNESSIIQEPNTSSELPVFWISISIAFIIVSVGILYIWFVCRKEKDKLLNIHNNPSYSSI